MKDVKDMEAKIVAGGFAEKPSGKYVVTSAAKFGFIFYGAAGHRNIINVSHLTLEEALNRGFEDGCAFNFADRMH